MPLPDIHRRFARSLRHLPGDYAQAADETVGFMNDGGPPEWVFTQHGGSRVIHHADFYGRLVREARR